MRCSVLCALAALVLNTAQAETSLQLMELSDRVSKVVDARSELTMTLSNADGEQRVRKLVTMTKLKPDGINNMRVLRFLAPADIKGTVTLLIEQSGTDDDMWIYLPALKKTRRLVSDNKRDSFIGSDLTFGDLIGHKPADWTSTLLREETLDGKVVYVIESLPKDEAVKSHTGYSKRLLWIDKNNFTALKTDYWDETGQLLKTIHVSDVRLVDVDRAKWQFMELEAENHQSGHKTVLHFDEYRPNQSLADDLFTPRTLETDQ
jgi:outer membrane lipoprotein-sorting protein